MSEYRRLYLSQGVYFFTLVTYQRKPIFNNANHIDILRKAFTKIKKTQPFTMDAIVILPDHLHCIWRLPENDCDYSNRWREIKNPFPKPFIPSPTNVAKIWCGNDVFGNTPFAMKKIGAST